MKNNKKLLVISICTQFLLLLILIISLINNKQVSKVDVEYSNTKKIVLMIGDGMGFNHLEVTKKYYNINQLTMESLSIKGKVCTNSSNIFIPTDSAAAATAMATGKKVYNNQVAYNNGNDISSITEYVKERGLGVGIVCTSILSDATPAAFSAHSNNRKNTEDIILDQSKSNIDIFLGSGYDLYSKYQQEFNQNGYCFVSNTNDLKLKDNKIIGSFEKVGNEYENDKRPNLSYLVTFAERYLETHYPNGYFLLIEGSHIDKMSHANNIKLMMEYLIEFDKCVKLIKDNMNDEKLLIVVADHETGGLVYNNEEKEEIADSLYTTSNHTKKYIPYFIEGAYIDGIPPIIDNTFIYTIMKNSIQKK